MSSQDANDVVQINSRVGDVPVVNERKKNGKLIGMIVVGCVVLGVALGIYVYQQSLSSTKIKPSSKPSSVVNQPKSSQVPVESPTIPDISVVNAEGKTVNFPKAGQLRAYYLVGGWMPLGIKMVDTSGTHEAVVPAGTPSTPMKIVDTGYSITGPTNIDINTYLGTDSAKLSLGWIKPVSNKCGANGFGIVDIGTYITWATEQSKGEPIVSVQCWADYAPDPKDNSAKDFNDYTLIWSYTPSGSSPIPSASVKASVVPSASPVASPKSPSPSPSRSPSPSPSKAASPSVVAVVSPSPSPRVVVPDTSDGVPVTGIFEVTIGTVSVGLVLLLLGLIGLVVF